MGVGHAGNLRKLWDEYLDRYWKAKHKAFAYAPLRRCDVRVTAAAAVQLAIAPAAAALQPAAEAVQPLGMLVMAAEAAVAPAPAAAAAPTAAVLVPAANASERSLASETTLPAQPVLEINAVVATSVNVVAAAPVVAAPGNAVLTTAGGSVELLPASAPQVLIEPTFEFEVAGYFGRFTASLELVSGSPYLDGVPDDALSRLNEQRPISAVQAQGYLFGEHAYAAGFLKPPTGSRLLAWLAEHGGNVALISRSMSRPGVKAIVFYRSRFIDNILTSGPVLGRALQLGELLVVFTKGTSR
jgi:hypothetical protein